MGRRARAGQKVARNGTKSRRGWREAMEDVGNAVGSVKGKKWGWRRAGGWKAQAALLVLRCIPVSVSL